MSIRSSYKHTVRASYVGYITQAILNNYLPLLFVTFQKTFDISLQKIGSLITINFILQLLVDLVAAKYVDRIGYRPCIIAAHLFAAAGLVSLSVLPFVFDDSYIGVVISILIYSLGGGLIEVLISPIVEACPSDEKSAAMSLLHSFYCWGHVGVVALTTLFFVSFGIANWRILACLWALIPFLNAVYFLLVPINTLCQPHEKTPMKNLGKTKLFWIFIVLMLCAGSSEQALSQWSSAFAEIGLGVSKTVGDLLGPCMFAALMGASRVFYAKFASHIDLRKCIIASCGLCIVSYLVTSLVPSSIVALAGCGLCGLSVGILWPGVFSLAAARFPTGGTAMFAIFALAGDLGCATGPTFVSTVSGFFGDNLKSGLLFAILFPCTMMIACFALKKRSKQIHD